VSAVYFDCVEVGHAPVEVDFFRVHGVSDPEYPPRGTYLLTISIRPSIHGHAGAYPQAWSVMDDFGTLRIVEKWS
jgi:hypothetical protein